MPPYSTICRRALTDPPTKRDLKSEPKTRSKDMVYSSPSMLSASTQHPENTNPGAPISGYPLVTPPLYHAHKATLDHSWPHTYPYPGTDGSEAVVGLKKREQSPVAALLQRRGIIEDLEPTPRRSPAWAGHDSHFQIESPRIYGIVEEPHTSQETVVEKATSRAFQSVGPNQTRAHSLGLWTDHPSSESDSTYKASSPPVLTSSPPPRVGPQYTDQAEEGTNSMMAAFLLHLCSILSRDPSTAAPDTVFGVSYNVGPLRVPIGDGGFIKTIPDLEINVEKGDYSTPILDYEGKRLRPNMTSIERFAQSVAHLIGRASWNRAARATSSRNVYLLTAQHTSVSIMQCTLLHKWLERLPSDLKSLKRFARVQVQEYGPVDLADGAERLVAAQMICRLLAGLGMAARLGEEGGRPFVDTQIGRQGTLDETGTMGKIGADDRACIRNDKTEDNNHSKKRKTL